MYEICLKLTFRTPGQHQWRRSAVFIVNIEQISPAIPENTCLFLKTGNDLMHIIPPPSPQKQQQQQQTNENRLSPKIEFQD